MIVQKFLKFCVFFQNYIISFHVFCFLFFNTVKFFILLLIFISILFFLLLLIQFNFYTCIFFYRTLIILISFFHICEHTSLFQYFFKLLNYKKQYIYKFISNIIIYLFFTVIKPRYSV